MRKQRLIVRLKGGLGNQMFQYAAGRALATRRDMQLTLDIKSGFVRDKLYRRSFLLDAFAIQADKASFLGQLPFWFEQAVQKYHSATLSPIFNRLWGDFLYETELRYLDEIVSYPLSRNTWVEGHWQSEEYFADCRDLIGIELTPPKPETPQFLSMAKTIEASNSVAVGVRIFEEVPSADKSGVGGVVPFLFYEEAANRLKERVKEPSFFVFCTTGDAVGNQLKLPGPTYYITHDNGFDGAIQRLWLISRCRHHIISNSSFYWWGAWLGERQNSEALVIASDLFTNRDTIPTRWKRYIVHR